MIRFNNKGLMVFPNPIPKTTVYKSKKLLVIKECYCQNGHSLISERADFNGFSGIVVKVKKKRKSGLVAIGPVYGDKSRVAMDVVLKKDDIWNILCPECEELLPVHSHCECEGSMIALFTDTQASFSDCICICNRVGCMNSTIQSGNELITTNMIEHLL